jgi:hypothetical protein
MKIIFESELKINSYTHRVVTLGILAYRDFLKYLITIQEFTICLNINIIHLKEKLKFIQKPFIKINGMLREINFNVCTLK